MPATSESPRDIRRLLPECNGAVQHGLVEREHPRRREELRQRRAVRVGQLVVPKDFDVTDGRDGRSVWVAMNWRSAAFAGWAA